MAKILIVSAVEDARELIIFALRFAGHKMKSVSTVEDCVDQAQQFSPDLILLDDTLAPLDGIDTTRYLKSQEATASIPLVLFTPHPGTEVGSDENTGVDDGLILNSNSPDQLTDKVNSMVMRLPK